MTLRVTLVQDGSSYGPYTLVRGGNPWVYKCL